MPTVTVVTVAPLVLQVAFDQTDLRALAIDRQDPMTTTAATLAEHAANRIGDYLEALARRYRERVTNTMLERFNAGTPEQQAQALAIFGGLPDPLMAERPIRRRVNEGSKARVPRRRKSRRR